MAALIAEGLGKRYGERQALTDVSFSLSGGELVGLIGQNGAGKTTLLQLLAGRLAPSAGRVTLDGHDVLWEPEHCRAQIGYLPEKPGLYDEMTVEAHLRFLCRVRGVVPEDIAPHVAEIAERTGIQDALGRRVGNLSKGFRQRVGIASALVAHPAVILLDEPTSGLDPVQIHEVRQLVSELSRDRLVILSTHILRDLDGLCSRALILHEGRLIRDLRIREEALRYRTLRVELAMGKEAAMKLLASVPSAERVEALDTAVPGQTAALLTGPHDAPIERQLFELASRHSAPILALHPVRSELEEIFLSAIGGEAVDAHLEA